MRQNSAARGMNERVKWQRVTDSSGACVTRRRPAVHGTGRRAPQPRRAGISTVFDTRTSTDARGTGPPARQQLGEGIWSACDMHMRMDARGAGPSAGQQPGEGIWSAFAMHATTDARVPRAVDTCESSNLRSHSRSTTSVATKIDLASRVPRASCPTLEESRRRRTAPALFSSRQSHGDDTHEREHST